MNHLKRVSCLLILGMFALLVSACSTPAPIATPVPTATAEPTSTPLPTSTPEPPTATPTPETEEWNYVGIAVHFGYPNSTEGYFTAHIEADQGVKVNPTFKSINGMGETEAPLSSDLLAYLQSDQKLRDAIRDADIVTVIPSTWDIYAIGTGDYRLGDCGGEDNMDCVREDLVAYRASCDAIYKEILSLCKSGAIVRTMTFPHWGLGFVTADETDYTQIWTMYNDQIIESAAEHKIPIAQVELAFHGASRDEDAADKGYLTSDGVTMPEGMQAIADLWRELGYEPTVP